MVLVNFIGYIRKSHQFLKYKSARKILVGSGGLSSPGWLATDKELLNIIKRDAFLRYWKPNSRTVFFAEHVWEHLTENEAMKASANCFEFLKSHGKLRIAVPDGLHPDSAYIEAVCPGGTGAGAEDHKVLYNYRTLTELLKNTGFEVELLEYWDENGKFHFKDWSLEDGHVRRSKRYDQRNQDGTLTYTSLIADATKP